jgi:hypothetical protein
MQCVADTSDGISTRQRSFLGRGMAMPTNRRFPSPWSIEDTGAVYATKDGGGKKNSTTERAAGEGLGRLLNILNNTPDRFWLDAHFVSGMTKRLMSVQQTLRAKKCAWPSSNLPLTISPLAPNRPRC